MNAAAGMVMIQVIAISPALPQRTARGRSEAPMPMIEVATTWVVETGAPKKVAKLSHRAAASSAANMAVRKVAASGIKSGSMMPLEMVATTSPPAINAPAVSKMAAINSAPVSVSAREPTAGPTLLATSFAPMFIAMSFAFGLAIFILLVTVTYKASERPLGDLILFKMRNLLGVFIAAVLYFTTAMHLTNLYAAEHIGVERFILMDGGIYTFLFWVVQIGIGSVFPLALLFNPATGRTCQGISIASMMVIAGGLAQLYVIIVGGQAFPLQMFPGMEVSSSFFDGQVHGYAPSLPEVVLGLSGIATALLIVAVAVKYLPLLPISLSDTNIRISRSLDHHIEDAPFN